MKKTMVIEGMDNMQMGRAVVDVLERLDGVNRVALYLDEEALTVDYTRGALTEDDLCDAVNEEGFGVSDIFD